MTKRREIFETKYVLVPSQSVKWQCMITQFLSYECMYQCAIYECRIYKNENISSYILVLKVLGQVLNSRKGFDMFQRISGK